MSMSASDEETMVEESGGEDDIASSGDDLEQEEEVEEVEEEEETVEMESGDETERLQMSEASDRQDNPDVSEEQVVEEEIEVGHEDVPPESSGVDVIPEEDEHIGEEKKIISTAEQEPEAEANPKEIETSSEASASVESSFVKLFGHVEGSDALPVGVQSAIMDRWRELRNELDESRPRFEGEPQRENFEQRCAELEATVSKLREELSQRPDFPFDENSELQKFRDRLDASTKECQKLHDCRTKIQSENERLLEELRSLRTELVEIQNVSQTRQDQFDALEREKRALEDDLIEARSVQKEYLVRAENFESRELALQYKEKRLSDEKALMEERVSSLTEELHRNHEELLEVKRENVSKIFHLQNDVREKTEYVTDLENKVRLLEEEKSQLSERVDDYIERLKAARNSTNLEEAYRQEIKSQTRLAEIYKSQVEDSEEKCQELAKAVESLQSLLKESSERYETLEESSQHQQLEHQEELRKRNEAIRALKKELDDANTLLETLKKTELTHAGASEVSPSVAVAMKIANSGLNLTQVYTQLVACEEELLKARSENERLNNYVEQIVSDIEERAPALKRLRDDYEHVSEQLQLVEQQLEEEKEFNMNAKKERELNRQRLASSGREIERLKKQVTDLGNQVTILLREVECARFGGRNVFEDQIASASFSGDADTVISQRLVTFKSVKELQQRNIELLAVVRKLSSEHERGEMDFEREEADDLKRELELVNSQIEELREARRRQENMIENLIQQRDMYKSMAESYGDMPKTPTGPKVTSTPAVMTTPSPKFVKPSPGYYEAEARASKAESELTEVKKLFEEFKQEKVGQLTKLEEKLEKTQTDLDESRAKSLKLASQEEYNTERFKTAQNNIAVLKKEISQLETKRSDLQATVAKHEQTIQMFQAQIIEYQSRLNRADSQLARTQQEALHYKNAEMRLSAELSNLQRQSSGSNVVAENLKKLQMQFDKSENEEKKRLQTLNESLSKEISMLRKKLDSEQESYRTAVVAWQQSQNELRDKLDLVKSSEADALKRLNDMTAVTDELKDQLRASQEKFGEASGSPTPKIADLQAEIRNMKNDCVHLKELLSNARHASENFKSLAESAETRLLENTEATRVMQEDYEAQLTSASKANALLEEKIRQLSRNRDDLMDQVRRLESREDPVERVERELSSTRAELTAVLEKLEAAGTLKQELEQEISRQGSLLRDMEMRYEREVVLHGQTTEALVELRETSKLFDDKIVELETAKRMAEEKLQEYETRWRNLESSTNNETERLKEQVEVLEKENAALHNQLANVTHQMSTLNKSGTDLDTSLVGNETSDQLMDIIKYLRREKNILMSKIDSMQSEMSRLQSQLETSQNEMTELKQAYDQAVDKSDLELMPSSKYSQLLQSVEAIPSLNESNRILRQTNQQLEKQLEELKAQLEESSAALEPLQQKLRECEEREDKLLVELEAMKGDNDRWRQRTNQLIEKNQKINPEEVKRLESENAKFSTQVRTLQAQLKQHAVQVNALNSKLREKDEKLTTLTSSKEEEVKKLTHEVNVTKTLNQQIGARLNLFNKKVTELEANLKATQSERDSLKGDVDKLTTEAQTGAKSQGEMEAQIKALTSKIEALEQEIKERENNLKSSNDQIMRLKALGRSYKVKFEKKEAEVAENLEALAKIEEELKKARQNQITGAAAEPRSDSADDKLKEAEQLVEESASRISDLEDEITKLKEENQKLSDTATKAVEKENRAKGVLVNAKERITTLTNDNETLRKEIAELRTGGSESSSEQAESQMNSLRAEKDHIIQELTVEKERLLQQIEQLQQELKTFSQQQQHALSASADKPEKTNVETVTASVKPVLSTATTTTQRKSTTVHPQAHIQPTRHTPAQTATMVVRPTAMRPTPGRTTSQSGEGPPQMSVQPIISSVPPMTAHPQQDREQTSATASNVDEVRTALVPPRQSSEEPTPGPSHVPSSTASESFSSPVSVVSVAPTQKRIRDESETGEEVERKKLRVGASEETPSTENVIDLESSSDEELEDVEEGEGGNEQEADFEEGEIEGEEEEEEEEDVDLGESDGEQEEIVVLDSDDEEGGAEVDSGVTSEATSLDKAPSTSTKNVPSGDDQQTEVEDDETPDVDLPQIESPSTFVETETFSNVASPEGQVTDGGDAAEGEVGEPISTVSSSAGSRARGPRLTRTPIVWNESVAGQSQARGRGGTARRSRGSFVRGSNKPRGNV